MQQACPSPARRPAKQPWRQERRQRLEPGEVASWAVSLSRAACGRERVAFQALQKSDQAEVAWPWLRNTSKILTIAAAAPKRSGKISRTLVPNCPHRWGGMGQPTSGPPARAGSGAARSELRRLMPPGSYLARDASIEEAAVLEPGAARHRSRSWLREAARRARGQCALGGVLGSVLRLRRAVRLRARRSVVRARRLRSNRTALGRSSDGLADADTER